MDEVMINGVRYTPADDTSTPRLAIVIKTHDRPREFAKALDHHQQHLPAGASVYVVDDGSTPAATIPDWVAGHHRFTTSRGIVAAGNKALELAMDSGAAYISVWDDDAWPVADDWATAYLASDEPHLAYQFIDLAGPRKLKDIAETYRDNQHVAYTGQRGVMLWYRRDFIETVGGYDTAYGRGFYEHSDLALRGYHAGLTTWPYADVVGSEKLIYSLDEHEKVDRTVPTGQRQQLVKRNAARHNQRREAGYTAQVPYREPVDVVLTHLLTAQPDPQRGKQWPPEAKTIRAWADSITGADPVVLVDRPLTGNPGPATTETVPVAQGQHVYRARWTHSYRWLRAHPEVRWAWLTDGSDVIMQNPPWQHMTAGTLYVGSEPKTLADPWLRKQHPARRYQQLIDDHPGATLLNCGLVGGDRATLLELTHHMVREFDTLEADRFWKKEPPGTEVGDMAAFSRVVYTHFADRFVTGPQVHTVFRAEEKNGFSWFKHR